MVGVFFIPQPHWVIPARLAFYASVAGALTYFGAWPGLARAIRHLAYRGQYIRLICEHSAVEADEDEYSITRTTLPSWLEAVFILPRNVGFHIEHHWYPSVPFYRLPELHQLLMAREGFQAHAVVRRSVVTSLGECIQS